MRHCTAWRARRRLLRSATRNFIEASAAGHESVKNSSMKQTSRLCDQRTTNQFMIVSSEDITVGKRRRSPAYFSSEVIVDRFNQFTTAGFLVPLGVRLA